MSYFFVKPSKDFSLCCVIRSFKLLVTPTYNVPFLLLNRMYVKPFFCIKPLIYDNEYTKCVRQKQWIDALDSIGASPLQNDKFTSKRNDYS